MRRPATLLIRDACRELEGRIESFDFLKISVKLFNENSYWLFEFEGKILLEFWPGDQQIRAYPGDKIDCASLALATRRVLTTRKKIVADRSTV